MSRGSANKTHGLSNSPEHRAWAHIKTRCTNPNIRGCHRYGGRGIKMHSAWARSFTAFFKYVGPRPSPAHSIDRYPNNDGNYEPGNVRWATRKEQARNTSTNRRIQFRGVTLTLAEWAERLKMKPTTLSMRLNTYGWNVARAFREPARKIHDTAPPSGFCWCWRPVVAGLTRCAVHRAAENKRERERQKHRPAGMCHSCIQPAVSGRSRCARHLALHKKAQHARWLRKKGTS